jgi:hypothetical protein
MSSSRFVQVVANLLEHGLDGRQLVAMTTGEPALEIGRASCRERVFRAV